MIPTNAVRCQDDNGAILYPTKPGTPYKCETCGAGLEPGQSPGVGEYWTESYGYLCLAEVVEDERDTEEELSDLYYSIAVFARILGDQMTAHGVGGHFTCSEAEDVARELAKSGHKHAAMTFLEGHAYGDDDPDDLHTDIDDYEAWVLELADQPIPTLVEGPKDKAEVVVESTTTKHELEVVTTEELVVLLNLH
ncbi:hypothetical protein ACOB87_38065 [Streptomyces sp. YS-B37]|uniref:hypothetical protein n=1 Tax=Streptomyces sp. YS-B37 TaxID=3407669 RepID=UPI003B50D62A